MEKKHGLFKGEQVGDLQLLPSYCNKILITKIRYKNWQGGFIYYFKHRKSWKPMKIIKPGIFFSHFPQSEEQNK